MFLNKLEKLKADIDADSSNIIIIYEVWFNAYDPDGESYGRFTAYLRTENVEHPATEENISRFLNEYFAPISVGGIKCNITSIMPKNNMIAHHQIAFDPAAESFFAPFVLETPADITCPHFRQDLAKSFPVIEHIDI